jgi:CBS-domain-containing membrane protein
MVDATPVPDRVRGLLGKMRGDSGPVPPRAPWRAIGLGALGGIIAIAVVAGLTEATDELLVLGSFGASCVLVFGVPDSPFSQPRNVVAGHVLSTLVGLVFLEIDQSWWSVAFAAGGAIAVMMATRTVHPPAGSNPVIVYLLAPDWDFVLFPTLLGAVLIVLVALVYNNLTREARYPKYW